MVPFFALFTLIFDYQFVKFIELFLAGRVQVLYFILHRVSLVLHQKLKYLDKKNLSNYTMLCSDSLAYNILIHVAQLFAFKP